VPKRQVSGTGHLSTAVEVLVLPRDRGIAGGSLAARLGRIAQPSRVGDDRRMRGFRPFASVAGWAALLLGLPLALLAAFHPVNEYRAALALEAVDCQGAFETWLLAVPVLVLYGAALLLHARRWRQPASLAVILLSLLLCGLVAANLVRAVAEQRHQEAACDS